VTTQGLSVMLSGWMRDGIHPAFVVGGADGLSDAVRGAPTSWSRSRRSRCRTGWCACSWRSSCIAPGRSSRDIPITANNQQ
jgi:hypothetical protein